MEEGVDEPHRRKPWGMWLSLTGGNYRGVVWTSHRRKPWGRGVAELHRINPLGEGVAEPHRRRPWGRVGMSLTRGNYGGGCGQVA